MTRTTTGLILNLSAEAWSLVLFCPLLTLFMVIALSSVVPFSSFSSTLMIVSVFSFVVSKLSGSADRYIARNALTHLFYVRCSILCCIISAEICSSVHLTPEYKMCFQVAKIISCTLFDCSCCSTEHRKHLEVAADEGHHLIYCSIAIMIFMEF